MLAVFLSPIYLLFQAYILLWLYAWADSCSPALHSLFFRIPVTVLYLFFAVSPLTGFLITKEPLHHFLRVISNYWLGTLEYILLFIITFDVIRRVTGHSFFMKYRYPAMLHTMPKNLVIFGGFAIGLILMVSIYGVLHARRVYVRQDPVVIEKSSSLPGLKIALIADLHLGYNSTKSHVRKIADTINSQNVDLVCIAGDLFDNDYDAIKDPDEVADILSDIKSRYGTYACWGNHDVSEKILAGFTFPQKETIVRDGRFTEFLHHAGITMLEASIMPSILSAAGIRIWQKKNNSRGKPLLRSPNHSIPHFPSSSWITSRENCQKPPMPVSIWTSPATPMTVRCFRQTLWSIFSGKTPAES